MLEATEALLLLDEYFGWKHSESSIALVFERNGGLDALEEAQKHPNKSIYDQAVRVLTTYFEQDN